jgi:hypothetical protein
MPLNRVAELPIVHGGKAEIEKEERGSEWPRKASNEKPAAHAPAHGLVPRLGLRRVPPRRESDHCDRAPCSTSRGRDEAYQIAGDGDWQLGSEPARRIFVAVEGADVAVVFYAGHGIQVAGRNYLLPIDARLGREQDLRYEALGLDAVLEETQSARRLRL